MPQSSASGRGTAQECSADQQVTVLFHQDTESQSAIHSKAESLNHARASGQTMRLAAFSSLVYSSRAIDDLITKIEHARNSSAPILITGETGTGKELLSRAVHTISAARDGSSSFSIAGP